MYGKWWQSPLAARIGAGITTIARWAQSGRAVRKVPQHLQCALSDEIVEREFGIRELELIELDLLPDGRGVLKVRPRPATIEEINEAAARGWAGQP